MNLKDAAANLNQAHPEDILHPLFTPWGEMIMRSGSYDDILSEYPRPQMRRTDYHPQNGLWEYAFVPADGSKASEDPAHFTAQGIIRVPFSPESLLSGVNRRLEPEEYLWYHRELSFSTEELSLKEENMRCILHFDAVDQEATVFLGTKKLGTHSGGYLPFSLDITAYVNADPVSLYVKVRDLTDTGYATRGKQTLNRGGMFYTAQSGIWQSVWYEWVPENYVINYKITPEYNKASVTFVLCSPKPFQHLQFRVSAPSCDGSNTPKDTPVQLRLRKLAEQTDPFGLTYTTVVLSFPASITYSATVPADAPEPVNFKPWSPEHPWLYPFTLNADEDTVDGYFAMRCFSVEKDSKGILRFCLNHKPYFLHGILDQGYWSDGLMTAPCDEAFVYDISLAKGLGFNMLRKHIKLESLRWYYHCDRLGMIVWQDMVSGGSTYHMPWVCYMPTLFPHMSAHTKDNHYELFSRGSEEGRKSWEQECLDTIDHLYNVPSIAVWVPFNEAWGQFDTEKAAEWTKTYDPSRLVNPASGGNHRPCGDILDLHNYPAPDMFLFDPKRVNVLGEYGGIGLPVENHLWWNKRNWGYVQFKNSDEVTAEYVKYAKELKAMVPKGFSAAVYTQTTDVEGEVNGLMTYDRKVIKIDEAAVKKANQSVINELK